MTKQLLTKHTPSPLFSERLRAARKMNGLSLQKLAEKAGNAITRQAIFKYEKGRMMPNQEVLSLLCAALNIRPEYLFRELKPDLKHLHFPKLERLPVKPQQQIQELIRDVLARRLELEEISGQQAHFEHPLRHARIFSAEDVEKVALDLRKTWNLGECPIINASALLEQKNIPIIEVETDVPFKSAHTWMHDRNTPVIIVQVHASVTPVSKRFALLEELAQLLLPLTGLSEKFNEKYRQCFAASLLLPAGAARKELGNKRNKISIQELGLLKQLYGISLNNIIPRLRNLEIISENYAKYYMQYLSQMGWDSDEPYPYSGPEQSRKFDQMLFRALSEGYISLKKAASLKNMHPAEFRSYALSVK